MPMLRSRQYDTPESDIRAVFRTAQDHIGRVIIELPILSDDEAVIASMISENAGAAFIKTSTGFKAFEGWSPSTPQDVKLIKSAVCDRARRKVAGGITTLEQAMAVINAGACRLGTSSGVAIVNSYRKLKTRCQSE